MTIGMGIFFLRGFYYLPNESFVAISNILMPAYLLIVGLMIGYLIITYYKSNASQQPVAQKQYVSSFIGWLVIGIVLALFYIFAR